MTSVLATLIGIWLVGRHGRRPLLMTGLVFVILAQVSLCLVLQLIPASPVQSYLAGEACRLQSNLGSASAVLIGLLSGCVNPYPLPLNEPTEKDSVLQQQGEEKDEAGKVVV